jgi:hypothetical protein
MINVQFEETKLKFLHNLHRVDLADIEKITTG